VPISTSDLILITGSAGFIGFHLSRKLLKHKYKVVGIDNLNSYYDVQLKNDRLRILQSDENFKFFCIDIADQDAVSTLFKEHSFSAVINLAAQAGVRYSIENPHAYLMSNLQGFLNILEACRHHRIGHLLYASSSSVYGANKKMPFSAHQHVDHPLSLYAASKKSNEMMAHAYSTLYNLPTTGLRFFTVYGPWGRPDMALFIFTKAILEGKPIDVYNEGKMKRDFTFVDDIVETVFRLIKKIPQPNVDWDPLHPDPASSFAPYRVFNIGNNNPVELLDFIRVIEVKLKKKAIKRLLPLQEGDVPETHSTLDELPSLIQFEPSVTIETGIGKFIDWYLDYYKVNNN
jgi:UDP-glucuronate 4-epimerase